MMLRWHASKSKCFFLWFKVQVDPGPEEIKRADKDENKVKSKNCTSVPPGPQRPSAPVQSSDSSNEDDQEEDSTMDPEVSLCLPSFCNMILNVPCHSQNYYLDEELLSDFHDFYYACLRSLT